MAMNEGVVRAGGGDDVLSLLEAAEREIAPEEGRSFSNVLPELPEQSFYRRYGKRALDVVGGLVLLVLLSPILLLAWIAVRVSTPGGALFAQPRGGFNGEFFVMYKFRSMYVDADERIDMEQYNEDARRGILYKAADRDPRVTPVGRLLRKTSIDELPQIWNVVKGDMSLVGPRPVVPHMLAPFPMITRARGVVRPGLTGLWQVSARTENRSILGMARYDIDYVKRCSLRTDLLILLKTPLVVLSMKGAQ